MSEELKLALMIVGGVELIGYAITLLLLIASDAFRLRAVITMLWRWPSTLRLLVKGTI